MARKVKLTKADSALAHRGALVEPAAKLFPPNNLIEKIGGEEAVREIVDGLYDRIAEDPVLVRLFPHTHIREQVKAFFIEWMGGPRDYSGWGLGFSGMQRVHSSA